MKTVLLIFLCITVLACRNNSQTQNEKETNAGDTAFNVHDDHEKKETKVELDNGNKWTANAETIEGINKMISILKKFPENSKPEDYALLKNELDAEFNFMLQSCTMTGEAHEQLHNYLLPMREMIQNLHSDNIVPSRENVNSLK